MTSSCCINYKSPDNDYLVLPTGGYWWDCAFNEFIDRKNLSLTLQEISGNVVSILDQIYSNASVVSDFLSFLSFVIFEDPATKSIYQWDSSNNATGAVLLVTQDQQTLLYPPIDGWSYQKHISLVTGYGEWVGPNILNPSGSAWQGILYAGPNFFLIIHVNLTPSSALLCNPFPPQPNCPVLPVCDDAEDDCCDEEDDDCILPIANSIPVYSKNVNLSSLFKRH